MTWWDRLRSLLVPGEPQEYQIPTEGAGLQGPLPPGRRLPWRAAYVRPDGAGPPGLFWDENLKARWPIHTVPQSYDSTSQDLSKGFFKVQVIGGSPGAFGGSPIENLLSLLTGVSEFSIDGGNRTLLELADPWKSYSANLDSSNLLVIPTDRNGVDMALSGTTRYWQISDIMVTCDKGQAGTYIALKTESGQHELIRCYFGAANMLSGRFLRRAADLNDRLVAELSGAPANTNAQIAFMARRV